MLVCNVSLRPPRSAIAASLAEAVAATDATATGIVFATLVDDPASVGDIVNAYLGEIMLEAATATDTVVPVFIYDSEIVEAMTATDTVSATLVVATTTWDAGTVTAVTLSGGNLVATNTGTTATSQGAHAPGTAGKTTGKFYFEATLTTNIQTGGNGGVGIGTTASTYANMGGSATTGDEVFWNSGNIWANGGNTAITLSGMPTGTVVGCAIDLDNRKAWFRRAPSGNWNNSGTADPATNVGGITIPAGTMVPFLTFGGTGGTANNVITANFGASAFSGAVPSGFTSGWLA